MARKLVVEIIGDEKSYLRAAENTLATNTKLGASFKQVALSAEKSAAVQASAAVKSQALQRERIAASTKFAMTASTPQLKEAAFAQAATQQAKLDKELGGVQKATRNSALATAAYGGAVTRTTRETEHLSNRTAVAERDLNKIVRGGLAGSGVFSKLGRSLAFASSGFIAFAIGAQFIRSSIDAARELAISQRQVTKQLDVGGTSWKRYGGQIDSATLKLTHLAGFTHTDLLQSFTGLFRVTGNVRQALHLTAVSADVARGRHIALSAASNALAKAAGGSFSALRRLNIIVPQGATKMQALAFVQQKYAGQAKAGTSAQDRFNATFVASEEIIGTALLPTVTKYLTQLGNWLAKMNESGRLQRDVNHGVKDATDIFHDIGLAIHGVDRVTGSFANTLKLLISLKVASMVAGWITNLKVLATSWGTVTTAAETATVAQQTAIGAGGVGAGVAAGAAGGAAGKRVFSSKEAEATNAAIEKSLGRSVATASETGLATGVAAGASVAAGRLGGLKSALSKVWVIPVVLSVVVKNSNKGQTFLDQLGLGTLGHLPLVGGVDQQVARFIKFATGANPPKPATADTTFKLGTDRFVAGTGEAFQALNRAGAHLPDIANVTAKQELKAAKLLDKAASHSAKVAKAIADSLTLIDSARAQISALAPKNAVVTKQARTFLRTGTLLPQAFQTPGFQPPRPKLPPPLPGQGATRPLFGGATPIKLYVDFVLKMSEQIRQAQSALTKTTKDDVAAARQVVARVKRAIDGGHLQGKALIQALGLEASALSTIWSAEDAAAQKRAQKAQAAKAKIQAQLQNSIDPLKLEIALSRAEAFGKPILPHLRALLRAAQAALAKGLTGALEKQALDQITSLKQQIKDALATPTVTFALSPKLELALARDSALGLDPTKDLLKAKAAILKFIRTHKHNIAALTDAYNQLAAINQQLGSTASSALGLFRQASTRALTAGLGLTTAQRKALRARLSQLGPGGTVPGSGVGAGGFIIDPTTGRPFKTRRDSRPGDGSGGGGRRVLEAKVNLDLNIEIDGRHVEATVTRRQQRRGKRNPSQRRGPNAGG